MNKTITNEQIEKINEFLNERKTWLIKKVLKDLPDSKSELIINDLNNMIRNKGRSSIIESDIQDIIEKYKEKK